MARDSRQRAGDFESENTGGFLSGFLADEDEVDRRSLWRLGSWGAASVGAIIVALLASQSSLRVQRDQLAATDLWRQSQQFQSVARESQNEARRLASAVDTLNGDRDRLYSRVTVLEQGLDSVTGAIARQNSAAASTTTEPPSAPPNQSPAPVVAPVATQAAPAEKPAATTTAVAETGPASISAVGKEAKDKPAASALMASKSLLAPPDAAAGKLIEPETRRNAVSSALMPAVVASAPSDADAETDASEATSPGVAVLRTEFGVDVGGANSIGGLRALWRGLLKSDKALAELRPIIAVKEAGNGLGVRLRLVAGPLADAAAAAKICAGLIENDRTCETAVFDGQRLAMKADEPAASVKPAPPRKRGAAKRAATGEALPKKPERSTLSALLGKRFQ